MKRPSSPRRRRSLANSTLPARTTRLRSSSPRSSRGSPPGSRSSPERRERSLIRAHGTPEFREWIKSQGCVVCGRVPSDAAHLKSGGTGRKDDVAGTVPLCSTIVARGYSGHHDEYDGRQRAGGKRAFLAKYPHLDLPALAAEIRRAWLAFSGEAA